MGNQTNEELSFLDMGMEAGAKQLGEKAVDRVLNPLIDKLARGYGQAKVTVLNVFREYLTNASLRYNQVKTLATGIVPRTIIGPDNIYVQVDVQYQEGNISTATVEPLLNLSSNILISGTGGAGKTMLMRYLFLNTADRGEYIPILLNLRQASNQVPGHISVMELVRSSLNDFGLTLPQDQFEYCLKQGKFLLLMDGLDEVRESMAEETVYAIQKFSAKYPKNPCIVTSRPSPFHRVLETFTQVESQNLDVEQAVQLAEKLGGQDEKAREFCKQLRENLFEEHEDFAENPLLLSMMYLVFMRNGSVPEHLAEFYEKAYDALYSTHDTLDKGVYHREFKCVELTEGEFRRLFARFCFQSYFDEKYEFSEKEVLQYLKKSILKLKLERTKPEKFLSDLKNIVCMLIQEGDIYRFAHRSFQAYFAAWYISFVLNDSQQKKLYQTLLNKEPFFVKRDLFKILLLLGRQHFFENALESPLRQLKSEIDNAKDPNKFILFHLSRGYGLELNKENMDESILRLVLPKEIIFGQNERYVDFNALSLLRENIKYISPNIRPYLESIVNYTENHTRVKNVIHRDSFIEFDILEKECGLSPDETSEIYSILIDICHIRELRTAIDVLLSDIDYRRASLESENFMEEF